MFIMKKYVLFSLCLLWSFTTIAQTDYETNLKPKPEMKLADLMYAQGFYYSSAAYYKEVIRQKPEWRYPKYWLAMSYFKAKDYKNAEIWFKKFVNYRLQPKDKPKRIEKENNTIYNKARYYYGEVLKNNGKYDEAITQLKAFKAKYVPTQKKKQSEAEKDWIKKANIAIQGAEMALANNAARKVKVKSLGGKVNFGYEEASPVELNDSTIYYSALNKKTLVYIDRKKDIPPYKIYQSKKVNGEWQKGKALPAPINTEEYGTGNVALSADGKRMYFCTCYNNAYDEIICAINFAEKKGEKWINVERLNKEINNPNFTSTQPVVRSGEDNFDIVYFVSDREGGKGGMDIWYFIRTKKGNYKGPRPLRGKVNTPFDELTPFYNENDSALYFSSNGHAGFGGFDIFKSIENEELQWDTIINVGKPINSSADDLYYRQTPNKTSGYLVSNRDGGSLIDKRYRGDDLYSFEDFNYGVSGFVVKQKDEKSGKSIVEKATVKLFSKNEKGEKILIDEVETNTGEYFFKLRPDQDYTVEVHKAGFAPNVEYVSTKNLPQEDTINQQLNIEKSRIFATGGLFNENDSLNQKPLDNAIVKLLEKQSDGTYKTISMQRIDAQNPNYLFDLDLSKEYQINVNKDGFFAWTETVDFSQVKPTQDTLHQDATMSKIEVGKTYTLENILYEFGKATLTDASKKILDNLAKIMQENPLLIVELSAHTDAIGSDKANLNLSQARAQSCVDYLKSLSISSSRLMAKGYGESKPIAPNQNEDGSDNEAGRAKNRRTEFKVIGEL